MDILFTSYYYGKLSFPLEAFFTALKMEAAQKENLSQCFYC